MFTMLPSFTIWEVILFQVILQCNALNLKVDNDDQNTHRIVGGYEAQHARYPYMISIRAKDLFYYEQHSCGAAIIDPYWVLTAAHCLKDYNRPNVTKTIVPNYRDEAQPRSGDILYFPKNVIIHPKRVEGSAEYDIALIQLSYPIEFNDHLDKIQLPTKNIVKVGDNLTAIGWGITDDGYLPNKLYEVEIPVLEDKVCDERFYNYVNKQMICAGKNPRDTCKGDSGGPLISKGAQPSDDVLVGIVSRGPKDCGKFAAVYTDVYYFVPWIKDVINKYSETSRSQIESKIVRHRYP